MNRKSRISQSKEQELTQALVKALPESFKELNLMDLLSHGSSLLLREAIAAEITEHLGRGYYCHRLGEDSPQGQRNGYRKTKVDTPLGQISYDRPLVAYAPEFQSKYHTRYMRRPKAFADAIADMHVNGVATRNVKRALKAVTGKKVRLSKSTVSRITKKLIAEFQQWKQRDLSDLRVVYLILDAIRLGMRMQKTRKQSVMIAYAVLEDGSFRTISIDVKHSESDAAWKHFVADMKRRGLRDPLLTVSDGNHGVIESIENHLPTSWRQRCVKHKVENVLESIPKEKHDEGRKQLNRIFYGATGLEQAKMAIQDFKLKYRHLYPTAVLCLKTDIAQCLTYYLFPQSHWKRIRTSNRLERLNLEIKRRMKPIGRHPSEEGCLALVYQICIKHEENKYGFKADDLVQALWKKLREQKIDTIKQLELDLEAA